MFGGALHGFSENHISVLEIKYTTKDYEERTIKRKLDGYYHYGFRTQSSTGLLKKISGLNNSRNLSNLEQDVIRLEYGEYGLVNISIGVQAYLKIEYYDVFNKNHIEYYKLGHVYESTGTKETEKIFEEYKDLDWLVLENLNANEILEEVLKDMNNL